MYSNPGTPSITYSLAYILLNYDYRIILTIYLFIVNGRDLVFLTVESRCLQCRRRLFDTASNDGFVNVNGFVNVKKVN